MMSVVSFFVLFHLLSFATINISFCNGNTYNVSCIQTERQALLTFKHHLSDPSNRLASWTQSHPDCCNWVGVLCHNVTGHVLLLNLQNPHTKYFTIDYSSRSYEEYEAYNRSKLGGKINRSLLDLKYLILLDLSFNDFEGIQIPKFLGSMGNLRYLNLSSAGFAGMIPQQLGNLSNLQYLDFSSHYYNSNELYVENLMWISGLSLLKRLDLSGINLSDISHHWLLQIRSLPYLEKLVLSRCELQHSPQISIANFSSLTILDLSGNRFDNSFIASWVSGLNHLVFLDLSSNGFQGPIPIGLKNLTSLRHLDLSSNGFQGPIINGLKNLISLRHLDLSCNYFQGPIPNGLKNLTSLRHLDLSVNNFNSSIPYWLSRFNDLEYLSLWFNNLQGSISSALGNLTSIITLDLSYNNLEGRIPTSFGRFCNLRSISISYANLSQNMDEILDILSGCVANRLESLDLSTSNVFGHLTQQLGQFKNLKTLNLYNNSICGPIPSSLGKLSSLETFYLGHNKLNGTLSEVHLSNLTRLKNFDASESSISLKVNSDWIPPFQLESLDLRSCHMGPHFPSWLLSQKSLVNLDISNAEISDIIPNWFWKSLSQFSDLNLSHNQIFGEIPNSIDAGQSFVLDLSSNKFFGPLPVMSLDMTILDLSNNAFSGSTFPFLCQDKTKSTQNLNLENNLFSGELPDCWMNWQKLTFLNLGNNNFTGNLPTSMGILSSLNVLILSRNNFSGVIPSLENYTNLEVLDVAENQFAGCIPSWIGERFPEMKILNLRSNKFHGLLPMELCRLASLQILDLADNNLSGNIPRCVDNFTAMVTMNHSAITNGVYYYSYSKMIYRDIESHLLHALLFWKGKQQEYSTILNLVRAIDLSRNNFSGEIPREVASLGSLRSLNLSYNSFTGRMPENIGDMRLLESMDLSVNQLSGEIPQSISSLTFLSVLNLSSNKLTGEIPSSTQLQLFDASSFKGNELCGPPLAKNCTMTVAVPELENNRNRRESNEVDWFYVSMAVGFVMGFWGLIGSLIANRRWRYSYWLFLDHLEYKFCSVIRKWF